MSTVALAATHSSVPLYLLLLPLALVIIGGTMWRRGTTRGRGADHSVEVRSGGGGRWGGAGAPPEPSAVPSGIVEAFGIDCDPAGLLSHRSAGPRFSDRYKTLGMEPEQAELVERVTAVWSAATPRLAHRDGYEVVQSSRPTGTPMGLGQAPEQVEDRGDILRWRWVKRGGQTNNSIA